MILSPTPEDLPQAFITNTSLTAMQAMVSTPLARIWSASSTKPGWCFASHVGVKAPGTENSTTVLPLNSSSVERSLGPSLVIRLSVPAGMRSPALIAIGRFLSVGVRPRGAHLSNEKGREIVSRRPRGFPGAPVPQAPARRLCLSLLRVQGPEVRELLQDRVALDGLEGLDRLVLVAALQLRDTEQQVRLGVVLHAALGDTLGDEVRGLVVLTVAEIRQAHAHDLGAARGGIRLFLGLRQARLIGRRGLLDRLEQARVAVL